MSLPIEETMLERYLDGELAREELSKVESALESSQECRDYLDELTRIRTMMRADVQAAVAVAPLDGLWDRIVGELDRVPAGVPAEPVAAPTLIDWLRAWLAARPIEVPLNALVAVAAILVCVWFAGSLPDQARSTAATEPVEPLADVAQQDNTLIVESAEVDLGTIVIDVDPEDPSTPAVVWHLVDEEGGQI